MEGHCLTGQSPQWAVVPMEEEEEEEEEEEKNKKKGNREDFQKLRGRTGIPAVSNRHGQHI